MSSHHYVENDGKPGKSAQSCEHQLDTLNTAKNTPPLQEKIAVVARLRPTKPSSNVGGAAEYLTVGG